MTSKQKLLCLAATSLIAMSTFTGMANANGNASAATEASKAESAEPGLLARLFGTASDSRAENVSYADPHYGSADYVCSPSGFGMRSHCSRRGY